MKTHSKFERKAVALKPAFLALLIVPFLLLSPRAFSFEGWEHQTVSTMSLIVASNYVSISHAAGGKADNRLQVLQATNREFINGLKRGDKPSTVNYGIIVELVDYMHEPYTMLHRDQTGSGWPSNTATCNLSFLEDLSDKNTSLIGASHVNYDHFQGRAMFTFWLWHKQAIEAAESGNLWGALMLDAYANHFLEDTFAPGHLLAPRDDDAHDMYTLMMHDYFNKRGLTYTVTAPEQLVNLARSMQGLVHNAPLTVETRGKGHPVKQISLNATALKTFADSLTNQAPEFLCYGDNRIKQNPRQLPLVVAYCARAICDVLDSYLNGKATNSFENYKWECRFFPMRNKPRIEALDFEYPFGKLTSIDHPRTLDTNDFLFQRVATTAEPAPERLTYPMTEEPAIAALHNRAVGFSFGLQTLSLLDEKGSGTEVRGLWEAGTIVFGRRFDQIQADWRVPSVVPNQFVVALGYSGVADLNEQGHGAFVRTVIEWPQVNLDLSLTAGARYYFGDGRVGGFGDYESVRVEWGMHMSSIFIGIGHDHYPTQKSLSDGLMFEAGVTFALPMSRWEKFLPGSD